MRRFLTILEGRDPATARPILATEDQEIIGGVCRALILRLAPCGDGQPRRNRGHDAASRTCVTTSGERAKDG